MYIKVEIYFKGFDNSLMFYVLYMGIISKRLIFLYLIIKYLIII